MAFDDVKIHQLRALRAVAVEGSFVGAADILGFSQAAISQQIATLEKAVGTALFDRPGGPKPVSLTPAGRRMLTHADAVMDRLATAERELADIVTGTAGRLVVGTYQSVSVQLLPVLVRELRSLTPDIDIHLVERDENANLLAGLFNGELDVTFLVGPYHDTRVDIVELGVDPFVAVLGTDSDLARAHPADTLPTSTLIGTPMIGQHDCDCQLRIDEGLRACGVRPHYVFRSNDNGAMQGMVRAGMGPAVMPLLAVDTDDSGIVVKKLDPPLDPRTILIATRRGVTALPAATRFVEIATAHCRDRLASS